MAKRVRMKARRGWQAVLPDGESIGPAFDSDGLEYLRRVYVGGIGGKYGVRFARVLVTEIVSKAKAKKKAAKK